MQFMAFETNVEVNGQTILSVVEGLGQFKEMGFNILKENGIVNPQPNKWYGQQAWLNAFKFIAEKLGPFTLRQIGNKIPEHADWPPQIQKIEDALASIDVAYHMNHRKDGKVMFNPANGTMIEGIGHYGFEKTGEKEAKMTLENPYPCEFDKGIVEAVAKRFKPKDSLSVTVKHDDELPCRKKGENACTIIVKW